MWGCLSRETSPRRSPRPRTGRVATPAPPPEPSHPQVSTFEETRLSVENPGAGRDRKAPETAREGSRAAWDKWLPRGGIEGGPQVLSRVWPAVVRRRGVVHKNTHIRNPCR